jgi:large subunit ribosomal protein L29
MLELSEIKDWSDSQIENKVSELRKELFTYKMQKTTTGLEKTHLLKDLKKDIARLLTVKNKKRES